MALTDGHEGIGKAELGDYALQVWLDTRFWPAESSDALLAMWIIKDKTGYDPVGVQDDGPPQGRVQEMLADRATT